VTVGILPELVPDCRASRVGVETTAVAKRATEAAREVVFILNGNSYVSLKKIAVGRAEKVQQRWRELVNDSQ